MYDLDRFIGQWNRIVSPEINPQVYGQLINDQKKKKKKLTTWKGSRKASSANGMGKLDGQCKKRKLDSDFISFTKINSSMIKDIEIKLKSIKYIEADIDIILSEMKLGGVFLMVLRDKDKNKTNTNKLDYIELKVSAWQNKWAKVKRNYLHTIDQRLNILFI